ncbi:MAG TPA: hypothetical protein VF424_14450 [Vicinamibacterales bacterium]
MTRLRVTGALIAIAVAAAGVLARNTAAQASRIEYDVFCTMDVKTKQKVFGEISPENRADLVRTQIQRWLDKNRSRLTAEQIKIMEENIAIVKADLYKFPRNEVELAKAKSLEQRTLAVMTREDMAEALTIFGSCIAKT